MAVCPACLTAIGSAGGNTYAYDEVGNQRTRPGATITYIAFDLPRTFTLDQSGVVTLDYDGNQRRIRKTTPEQQTVYVGDLRAASDARRRAGPEARGV